MPTFMSSDTRDALGPNAEKCNSRSLLFDRFVDATAKEDNRKRIFTRAFDKTPVRHKSSGWSAFLTGGLRLKPDDLVFSQLQARLMLNMAGGVMENAGLCLDRFGVPYIPGSAVKGCARRAALAALREWCEAGGNPEHKPSGDDNVLTPVCEDFTTPAAMLAAIARVFGWCEMDWSLKKKDDRFISDFAWACSGNPGILKAATERLATHFGWKIEDKHRETPWESLPNFAGSVCFLPAYPVDLGKTGKVNGLPLEVPQLGKLELDVVTCHHREYYAGNPQYATAPDTEEPVPVVFPAVAPGHVFAFAVVPLRGCSDELLNQGRNWLKQGLETFGLGAKTNAGYGWFADVTESVVGVVAAERERLANEAAKKTAEKRAAAEAEAKAKAEADQLAKAPPHERFRVEYAKLAAEAFATQAKKYAEMNDEQRHGFVLALKDKRDTAKRWAKKKPDLFKPWQEHAQKLQPPIQLP